MSRIDKKFTAEVEVKQVVLEVARVAQIDGRIAGIDDGLDQVNGVVKVDVELD